MSRIGKKLIKLDKNSSVELIDNLVTVKGAKGQIDFKINENFSILIESGFASIIIKETTNTKEKLTALHGLYGSLLKNALIGVNDGFKKKLLLVGVGYKAQVQANKLILAVGYSHPVEYVIPEGLTVTCPDVTTIDVIGTKKDQVGQFSAEIRSSRPPEPYKGKGIMYEGEKIRRKVGKAGKK